MADLTPEQVASREFRTAFRGYDPDEVRAFLSTVSTGLGRLLEEHATLSASAGGRTNLQSEIEAVTRDIGEVLQSAREAAEAMRERAEADSTRWRSEAIADAESLRSAAEEDAIALRSDAWTTAEQLLQQSQAESIRIRDQADGDALQVMGEAEREAHRLAANSRREADDILRAARMEAEQLVVRAKADHDEIITSAIKQSEAAQERTRALEGRRQELMRELELIRSTLNEVEGEVDQRRERLGLSEPSVTPVSHADAPPAGAPEEPAHAGEKAPDGGQVPGNWVPGETVRVVRKSRQTEPGEVVRPDVAPDVRVVSAAEMARRNDPEAPDIDEGEPPAREATPLPTGDDDDPVGTMVRPAEPPASLPAGGATGTGEEAAAAAVAAAADDVDSPRGGSDDPAGPDADRPVGTTPGPIEPEPAREGPREPDPVGTGDVQPVEELEEPTTPTSDEPPEPVPPAADPRRSAASPGGSGPAPGHPPPRTAARTDPARPSISTQSSPRIVAAADIAERHAALMIDEPASEADDDAERPEEEPTQAVEPAEAQPGESFEDLQGLFQRLRTDDQPSSSGSTPPADTDTRSSPSRQSRRADRTAGPRGVDPFELRDRLLLPVGNRALRSLKRQLTEEQNVVLEEIRLDEGAWTPDVASIHDRVRADLVVLHAESFGAGHAGAVELLGERAPRPATPRVDLAEQFAEALAAELGHTVTEGRAMGQGARQLGASMSRVFRAWRTDQAERRVREIALESYHDGLARTADLAGVEELRWVVGGRRCATCRARVEEPVTEAPPAHPGCECTVVP
jgi:DivIVA domain-containing protein